MKKVMVIDGQGGKLGRMVVEQIKGRGWPCIVCAIGTNSLATAAMLKAGADYGATGENPVLVNSRDADVIIGPVGILVADALHGEVTEAMSAAVGRCAAIKILLPVSRCNVFIAGAQAMSPTELTALAMTRLGEIIG